MIESLFHYLSNNYSSKLFHRFSSKALLLFITLGLITFVLLWFWPFQSYTLLNDNKNLPASAVKAPEDINSASNTSNVVEISGAVKHPGVYTVGSDARIVDVLKLSEGFAATADIAWVSKNISLAEKTTDSSKIYIPFIWESNAITKEPPNNVKTFLDINKDTIKHNDTVGSVNKSKDVSNTPSTNNINSCSKDILLALNGVGDVYASKIIANRPYMDLNDLISKIKLPEKVINEIESNLIF